MHGVPLVLLLYTYTENSSQKSNDTVVQCVVKNHQFGEMLTAKMNSVYWPMASDHTP